MRIIEEIRIVKNFVAGIKRIFQLTQQCQTQTLEIIVCINCSEHTKTRHDQRVEDFFQ